MLVQCSRKVKGVVFDTPRSANPCRMTTLAKAWSGNGPSVDRKSRSALPLKLCRHSPTFNDLFSRKLPQKSEKTLFIVHSVETQDEPRGEKVEEQGWDWFEWSAYNEKFEVPWNAKATALGMTAWLLTSVTVGFVFIPQYLRFSGVTSFAELAQAQRATCLLFTQTLETMTGLGVIYLASGRWGEDSTSSSSELFNFSLRRPFEKRRGWLIWALIGMSLSIVVNFVLSIALYQLGVQGSDAGTVDSVLNMLAPDPKTYLSLIAVVGVLAPLLEETVFRGFLLTSLMKWMPTYQAIIVSSLLFGCAHLTSKDLPYLTVVGAVWGFMYVRSRNLATPMLMHSAWNSSVLTLLYILSAMGVDLKELF